MPNFEFGTPETKKLGINAILLENEKKNRVLFDIKRQTKQIEGLLPAPPTPEQQFKIISGKKGFSSIAVITYIAERERIINLYVSTFHIGQKQMQILDNLKMKRRLENAVFLTSRLNAEKDDGYNYYQYCQNVCTKNNWTITGISNHSKIILMQTEQNFYVVETSSNLNENPKIEQYNFENDKKVFEFYKSFFENCVALFCDKKKGGVL